MIPLVLPPVVGGVGLLATLGRSGVIEGWLAPRRAQEFQLTFTTLGSVIAATFVSMRSSSSPPRRPCGGRSAVRAATPELGAGPRYALRRVVLSVVGPPLVAGGVLAWARASASSAPRSRSPATSPATQTMPLAVYETRQTDPGGAIFLSSDPGRALDRGARGDARSHHAGPLTTTMRLARRSRRSPTDRSKCDVALDVDDGETLALLGPNGAGKSTVVDALIGTLELADGVIAIDGERVDALPPEQRPIGVCFQDDLLFPSLSALENVAFPLRARKVPQGRRAPTSERTARAARPGRRSERTTELDVGRGATARRARASARAGPPAARARRAVLERRRLGPSGAAGAASARSHARSAARRVLDRARPARRADPRRPRCAARRRHGSHRPAHPTRSAPHPRRTTRRTWSG